MGPRDCANRLRGTVAVAATVGALGLIAVPAASASPRPAVADRYVQITHATVATFSRATRTFSVQLTDQKTKISRTLTIDYSSTTTFYRTKPSAMAVGMIVAVAGTKTGTTINVRFKVSTR